jgi:O-antigen/teichoic acid export membrane protein
VIRSILYFLTAVVFGKVCGFLLSLIIARTLSPADFGVWVTLTLMASYSPILCLGTVETLVKKVPFFLGTGKLSELRHIEGAVLSSVIFASCLSLCFGIVVYLLPPARWLPSDRTNLFLLSGATATSFFSGYFYNRLTAYQNFRLVSLVDVSRSIASFIFVGGCAALFGVRGAVIGFLIQEILVAICAGVFSVRFNGKLQINMDLDAIGSSIKIGLPISLLWWSLTLNSSVDRMVLGAFYGPSAIGCYSIGISLWSLFGLIPMVVGRVLYPKLNQEVGRETSSANMIKVVLTPSVALAVILVNLQIAIFFALPLLYEKIIPKYRDGLHAGQILTLGCFFICLYRNPANYLIAINKERLFFKLIFLTLLFNIVADSTLAALGFGLEGIATGTCVSSSLLTTGLWYHCLRSLGFSVRQTVLTVSRLYLPAVTLLVLILTTWSAHYDIFERFSLPAFLLLITFALVVNGMTLSSPLFRPTIYRMSEILGRLLRPAMLKPKELVS